MRDELLNGEIFYTLKETEIQIEIWRKKYNTVRPQSATTDDKSDYIIKKITSENVIFDPIESAFSDLTRREKKVLLLICYGKTNRDIAIALELGHGTVRNYVSSILSKLGLSNRAEAATYATEHGLKNIRE